MLVGVVDELLHGLRVDSVGDIEEVLPFTKSSFGVLIREELSHLGELEEVAIQILDGELVVLGYRNEVDVLESHEALVTSEDVLEHVLSAHIVGHHVVLNRTHWLRGDYLPADDSSCSHKGRPCWRTTP